jgi:hypothetical protein
MTYRENVNALAQKLGISNDPGLREEDLSIAQVTFVQVSHGIEIGVTNIPATNMNRGGRLFFQSLTTVTIEDEDRMFTLKCDDALREKAARYFAELWEPDPVPGKRILLDAIRDPKHTEIEIIWKSR